MKKYLLLIMSLLLILGLTGCGKKEEEKPEEPQNQQNEDTDKSGENDEQPEGKVLVVYFSATGNTKAVAEKIAAAAGADIYEIVAKQTYTSADLNWHDKNSRTTHEQNDSKYRPEIAGEKLSLEGYTTIFIGYPIWWGEEPRILDTFVENYDFTGITMIPFCTSSSSGMGRSGRNLANNAGSGNWLDGKRFSEKASKSDVESWVSGLKY